MAEGAYTVTGASVAFILVKVLNGANGKQKNHDTSS
jgi:hypothetical protein